jgi:hypothetical protein
MRSPSRRARRVLPLAAALLAASALLLTGCEDANDLAPEEQRIAVGASPVAVCPDPPAPSGAPGLGQSTIVATVFGDDGSVQEGLEVQLSASRGVLEETTLTTAATGQVDTTLSAPRSDEVPAVVTATTEGGATAEIQLEIPPTPGVRLSTANPSPRVGEQSLVLGFQIGAPCNVTELRFTLGYDPAVLDLSEREDGSGPVVEETGAMNAATGSGDIPTILEVSEDEPNGSVRILYRRDDVPRTGVRSQQIRTFLILRFDVLAPGPAELRFERLQIIPLDGRPYAIPSNLIQVPEIEGVEPPEES